ncbi:MAG: purple acid phosphatase, partial [Alistipes sp.]|nr:purple acid phosphatase [Alistipes sp.]
MKRLFLSFIFVLMAFVASAVEIKTPKTKCGPWVVGVSDTEMTIVWTTTERSMGWVEIAPDDGTSFYTVER